MAKVLDEAQKSHLAEHGYAVCKGVVDAATCQWSHPFPLALCSVLFRSVCVACAQWPHSLLCSVLSHAV